jgi:hypothetical protein
MGLPSGFRAVQFHAELVNAERAVDLQGWRRAAAHCYPRCRGDLLLYLPVLAVVSEQGGQLLGAVQLGAWITVVFVPVNVGRHTRMITPLI